MITIPNIPAVTPMSAATNIWLCAGIPWDAGYRNVRLYSSAGAASAYIISKAVYTITEATPIRNMHMRVNVSEDVINKNINYIAYQNTNLSNKMYYGFITNVEWLSVNACDITFEFDVFQTWYYDCKLERSFTVREHVSDDTVGAHIVPEGLDIGDLQCQLSGSWNTVNGMSASNAYIMALTAVTVVGGEVVPVDRIYKAGNVASGLGIVYWNSAGLSSFFSWMQTIMTAGQEASVAAVLMVPAFCFPESIDPTTTVSNVAHVLVGRPDNLNGYKPKNNKMLTFPYLRLTISDNLGHTMELRWEYSDAEDGRIHIQIAGYLTTSPVIAVSAEEYNSQGVSTVDSLTITDFPQCSWLSNAFYSWYAQNRNSLALSGITAVGSALVNAATGNIPGAVSSAMQVGTLLGSYADKQAMPTTVKGQVLNDNLNFARDTVAPTFYIHAPQADIAESIDNFLTMYGYKVNKLKVPETISRQSWNYVETRNCVVTGNAAREYIDTLEGIFNRGVTIWHTDDIGNYTLPNNIVSGG